MLGRYFKDIYNLNKVIKKKVKFQKNLLHDNKDLKFNLINFLLLLESKEKKFYEFGFTLYEKIFYFKFFNSFSNKKLILKKLKFFGNDISEKFIFFSENFYKDLKIKLSKDIKKKFFLNAVFFSKGITLLYEKKNILYLNNFINKCLMGSFDISLYPKKKIVLLETGYKLYYPTVEEFKKLLKNSNKHFFFRNKKKIGSKIYLEIIFGNKDLSKKINDKLIKFSMNKKSKVLNKYLSIENKFKKLTANHFR